MLSGLRHGYAVAKERLFPSQEHDVVDDTRTPHDRFSDLASKLVAVPKSEIDKREKRWLRAKKRRPKT